MSVPGFLRLEITDCDAIPHHTECMHRHSILFSSDWEHGYETFLRVRHKEQPKHLCEYLEIPNSTLKLHILFEQM